VGADTRRASRLALEQHRRHAGLWSLTPTLFRFGRGTAFRLQDAYLSRVKNLIATIGWLYEQTAHAQSALADLKSGRHNLEIRGRDKTQELVEANEHLIAKCQDLISGYKDRRDR
jgi:hypothetical protein